MTTRYHEVTLRWHEYAMASEIGRLRQLASIKRGSMDQHGFEGLGWSEHIEGACGEMAVSKVLGIYWDGGIDTFKAADISENIQVRTRSSHKYELIIRPNDADNDLFVLVTGKCPNYRIWGFISGKDGKSRNFLQEHGGRPAAYFVPQNELLPLTLLTEQIKRI